MVLQLRDLARDPPPTRDVPSILRGRSIVRHCRINRLKYWVQVTRRPAGHILRNAMTYSIPGMIHWVVQSDEQVINNGLQ